VSDLRGYPIGCWEALMSVFLETGTGDVGPENRPRVWFAAFTAFVSLYVDRLVLWLFFFLGWSGS